VINNQATEMRKVQQKKCNNQ